jgi:hypothetical protein
MALKVQTTVWRKMPEMVMEGVVIEGDGVAIAAPVSSPTFSAYALPSPPGHRAQGPGAVARGHPSRMF